MKPRIFSAFLSVLLIFSAYKPNRFSVKAEEPSPTKYIAFTFDDAPSTTINQIVDEFNNFNAENPDYKASATVFCNGFKITEKTSKRLKYAVKSGFELGNHSFYHDVLTNKPQEKIKDEIDKTDALLFRIDGSKSHLFRPPYGEYDEKVKNSVNTPIFLWTIDTLDWTKISAEEIYTKVMKNKFSGAIVLMHDGYENTVTAVKMLLPDLKKQGYKVVNLSYLIKVSGRELLIGHTYGRIRPKK